MRSCILALFVLVVCLALVHDSDAWISRKVKDKIKVKLNDIKDKVKDKLNQAKDKVKENLNNVKDKVKEKLNEAKDKVKEKLNEAKDKVKDEVNEAKDKVKEKLNEAKDKLEDLKEKTIDKLKECSIKLPGKRQDGGGDLDPNPTDEDVIEALKEICPDLDLEDNVSLTDVQKAFLNADEDGDGVLSKTELQEFANIAVVAELCGELREPAETEVAAQDRQ